MPARICLFICEIKAYQTCTTLSPQLWVKVTFLCMDYDCMFAEHLRFIVISLSSPLNWGRESELV